VLLIDVAARGLSLSISGADCELVIPQNS